jgi:hypothetical protein
MAFIQSGLKAIAIGGAVSTGAGSVCTIYSYVTNDTAELVEANGYFDGIDNDPLVVGDVIMAVVDEDGSPGHRMYVVTVGGGDVTIRRAANQPVYIPFEIEQTELLAGTSEEIVSPVAGRITGYRGICQGAVTTGGAVKLQIGTTDVTGATFTLANSDTKGTVYNSTAITAANTVAVGDRIQVVPAAAIDTAGQLNGIVEISPF